MRSFRLYVRVNIRYDLQHMSPDHIMKNATRNSHLLGFPAENDN